MRKIFALEITRGEIIILYETKGGKNDEDTTQRRLVGGKTARFTPFNDR